MYSIWHNNKTNIRLVTALTKYFYSIFMWHNQYGKWNSSASDTDAHAVPLPISLCPRQTITEESETNCRLRNWYKMIIKIREMLRIQTMFINWFHRGNCSHIRSSIIDIGHHDHSLYLSFSHRCDSIVNMQTIVIPIEMMKLFSQKWQSFDFPWMKIEFHADWITWAVCIFWIDFHGNFSSKAIIKSHFVYYFQRLASITNSKMQVLGGIWKSRELI